MTRNRRAQGTFKALIFALVVHVVALFIAGFSFDWTADSQPQGEVIQARVVDMLPPKRKEPKQKKSVKKKVEKPKPKKEKPPKKKAIPLKKKKVVKAKKTPKKDNDAKKRHQEAKLDLQRRLDEDAKERARAVLQGKRDKAKNEFIPLIKQKVQNNWIQPEGWGKGVQCVVSVRMVPSGDVLSATVIKSCGNPLFDRSVVNAVHKASPLPVPQDSDLFEQFRSINFTFNPKE